MGVSKNRGTPQWMVKIMENPIKMDDLGGKNPIFGYIYILMEILPFFSREMLSQMRSGMIEW